MKSIIAIWLSLTVLSGNAIAQVSDVFPIFLKDINPGPATSNPRNFFQSGDKFFFVATCTHHPELGNIGSEIWVTDGTPEGTHLTRDVNPGPQNGYDTLSQAVAYRGGLVFTANDGTHGYEIWFTDGTEEGTYRLTDIREGSPSSVTGRLTVTQDKVHFSAIEDINVNRWWVTEGTTETTRRYLDPDDVDLRGVGFFAPLPDGRIVTTGYVGSVQNSEPWISDGTPEGTMQIIDIEPSGGSLPLGITAAGGLVFFTADTEMYDREPYVTDGTASGTLLLADLRAPGGLSSGAYGFAPFQGEIVFSASPAVTSSTLYLTDGTPEGTREMFEGFSVKPNRISGWRIFGDQILISGWTSETGYELWRTDGTQAGTYLVKEITPDFIGGVLSNFVTDPVEYDGRFYFVANDGTENQVWRTTGVQGNAQKVTTHFSQLSFFPTRAGEKGEDDTVKGGGPIPPVVVGVINDQLLVVGQTEDTGMELWLLQGGNAARHWQKLD